MEKQTLLTMRNPVIKPTSDIFTAVLWSALKNEPLLRDFLNAVLINGRQPQIQQATVLNPFNVKEYAMDRQLILDVRVRDEGGSHYNIEFQSLSHPGFSNRMLLQWGDTYSAQLRSGDDFTKLASVKSVVVTDFPIFPELQDIHTIFEIRARENPKVLLSDHFQMNFLRLGDLRKRQLEGLQVLYNGLQHWVNFFLFGATATEDRMSQLVENNQVVMTAYREFQRFTADAEMRDLERRRRRFVEDQRIYVDAARSEGKAEGIAEGIAGGITLTAKNMKQAGADFDFIAKVTGLSSTEIEHLD